MLKRLLKISEYRGQRTEDRRQTKRLLHVFCLCSVICLLLTVSCAPKHIEMPSYEEEFSIENILPALKSIQSIEAVLSVEYEKNDSVMNGDASLNLSEDGLNLRLYYLGFLVGEVSEENGIVKSMPKIDKNKSTILVDGLKNSFLWWNIKDYILQEREALYVLKNSYREILISKKTLLPIQQTIELDDGEELKIFYDVPAKLDSIELSATSNELKDNKDSVNSSLPLWYNSRLKIEFKNNIVKIKVKSYSVVR